VEERQAGLIFNMVIPSRGATFHWLPAEPQRLEGLDYSLALVDECGVVNPETWQVVCLASGKREVSTVVGIGTPSVNPDSVLANARRYARDFPDDKTTAYREHSAAGFEDHPTTCVHCWRLANPALGDFLAEDSMLAVQPPKMSEAAFRRARLCQFVDANESPFIEPGIWDALSTGVGVRDGAEVAIALDGSLSDDSTALLVGTVSATPHFDKFAVWANPGDPEWRVPVLQVEDAIRQACRRWKVREVVADPAYWTRSLQILASEGLPIMKFPHSPTRQTAATNDLHTCALNGRMTHSGDETLRLHVLNATVVESDRGIRISKASRKRSAGKVDLCACLVMAHSRATWLAMKKKKRAYAFEERIDNLTQIMANDLDVQPDAAVESENTVAVLPDAEPDTSGDGLSPPEPAEDAENFPREYVEKLRKESAGYRDKAKTGESGAEEPSKRLHAALVTATGRLADFRRSAHSGY
jgi:phage terminase large subunit-like protein